MNLTIHKKDTAKTIHEKIKKAADEKKNCET